METPSNTSTIRPRDAGFALLYVISVVAVLLVQFVSLVVFDSTGLDRYVPGTVIYVAVPAVLTTIVPAAVALRRYGRRRALLFAAGVFVAAVAASVATSGFFVIG